MSEEQPESAQPEGPFTPLSQSAFQLHEFFMALVNAGFTVEQALYLAAAQASGGPKGPTQ